jgi:glutaconate CoA-transferase subunit B
MDHAKHRLSEKVAHLTSPGYETGNRSRQSQGLPEGTGPSAVITTLGVLRFGRDGESYLVSIHLGVGVEEVLSNTGAGIGAMRAIDSQGFWTGE